VPQYRNRSIGYQNTRYAIPTAHLPHACYCYAHTTRGRPKTRSRHICGARLYRRVPFHFSAMSIQYLFTDSAHISVTDQDFVRANPSPPLYPRTRLSSTMEEFNTFQAASKAYREWEQKGGRLTMFCPAIVEQVYHSDRGRYFFRDMFLDLSHVHRGVYDQPMTQFSLERYPRNDGNKHEIVVAWCGATHLHNINEDWENFAPDLKIKTIKHTMAIGAAHLSPHCNNPARVSDMVHDVKQLVGADLVRARA